jgi:uncharacterized protein DUF4383
MRSPAQIWARLIGTVLVVAGVLGFFYSSSFGSPGDTDTVLGILDVNGFHNLVHIATGGLGLLMGGSYSGARLYCFLLAAAYAVVAIWGFVLGDGGAILSIVPVNTEDNVLHALIGVAGIGAGMATPAEPAPTTAAPTAP